MGTLGGKGLSKIVNSHFSLKDAKENSLPKKFLEGLLSTMETLQTPAGTAVTRL